MAAGVAEAERNKILDAYARNVSYVNAAVWVKLHTADPGAAGATAPALNTSRQQATFASGAATGAISNTAQIQWTNVPNAETYAWISLWSASSAGNFLGNAQLATPRTVAVGDTFTIATGDLDITSTGA